MYQSHCKTNECNRTRIGIKQVYAEFFGVEGKAGCSAPARSAFAVDELPLKALVEIECVASR